MYILCIRNNDIDDLLLLINYYVLLRVCVLCFNGQVCRCIYFSFRPAFVSIKTWLSSTRLTWTTDNIIIIIFSLLLHLCRGKFHFVFIFVWVICKTLKKLYKYNYSCLCDHDCKRNDIPYSLALKSQNGRAIFKRLMKIS